MFAPLVRWRYRVTGGFRARRFDLFWQLLGGRARKRRWLDLGGGPGSYLLSQLATRPDAPSVIVLDIGWAELRDAQARFPHISCVCADGAHLPFADDALDLIFCNSVIEHVNQPDALAAEIQRVGQRFFVQTPNGGFPLESHSHVPLPFFRSLPRAAQRGMCRLAGAQWDYLMSVNYLDENALQKLFPGARIVREYAFGLIKSFYVLSAEDA